MVDIGFANYCRGGTAAVANIGLGGSIVFCATNGNYKLLLLSIFASAISVCVTGWVAENPISESSPTSLDRKTISPPNGGMVANDAKPCRPYTDLLSDLICLMNASVIINDRLEFHVDHVNFIGSKNDAEMFRGVVDEIWYRHSGWAY